MATKLTKPVYREVDGPNKQTLIAGIEAKGFTIREKGKRTASVVPFGQDGAALEHAVEYRTEDEHGKPIYVTLTKEGILFRRPNRKQAYLLPLAAGEFRAQTLAHGGTGQATTKLRKGSTKVSRGLLTIGR